MISGAGRRRERPSEFDLVIVGGGLTSARTIKAYREAGGDGKDRPRLSRLGHSPTTTATVQEIPPRRGRARGHASSSGRSFYDDNDVELLLSTAVVAHRAARAYGRTATIDDCATGNC